MRFMVIAAGMGILLSPAVAQGQSGGAPGCYRFTFGEWSPPLDWLRSGHDSSTQRLVREPRPSGSLGGDAAGNGSRESAVMDSTAAGQVLVLLPSWWPAGVKVTFPTLAAGEKSVRGVARAYVADGRAALPTASVTVWRVPCGGT